MGIKIANVSFNSRNLYLQGNKTWKQSAATFFCEACYALGVILDPALDCGNYLQADCSGLSP